MVHDQVFAIVGFPYLAHRAVGKGRNRCAFVCRNVQTVMECGLARGRAQPTAKARSQRTFGRQNVFKRQRLHRIIHRVRKQALLPTEHILRAARRSCICVFRPGLLPEHRIRVFSAEYRKHLIHTGRTRQHLRRLFPCGDCKRRIRIFDDSRGQHQRHHQQHPFAAACAFAHRTSSCHVRRLLSLGTAYAE